MLDFMHVSRDGENLPSVSWRSGQQAANVTIVHLPQSGYVLLYGDTRLPLLTVVPSLWAALVVLGFYAALFTAIVNTEAVNTWMNRHSEVSFLGFFGSIPLVFVLLRYWRARRVLRNEEALHRTIRHRMARDMVERPWLALRSLRIANDDELLYRRGDGSHPQDRMVFHALEFDFGDKVPPLRTVSMNLSQSSVAKLHFVLNKLLVVDREELTQAGRLRDADAHRGADVPEHL